MRAILTVIENIADTDATVLLRGESGVGKDRIARAIHARSARPQGPFVKVNCAAIPQGLMECELFGHEKGAFTGAHRRKPGQFEFANKGTIYLDELAELPLALQAKFNEQYGRQKQLSPETIARLTAHPWSGNVRELENVIRRMVVLPDGEQTFETQVVRGRNGHAAAPRPAPVVTEGLREIARRGA